jgi:hypothetical protein
MKSTAAIIALVGMVSAREVTVRSNFVKREVPQEHAHQNILNVVNPLLQKNNPLKIQDAVFGLLGNKAAAEGAPNVQNLDCLQQIVADQVFTNALAAGDVVGQANAIVYRALERNTGSVGLASVLCNQTAQNAQIAAITQHQDPASTAASGNKQIELNVAQQIASIGGDVQLALQSATFPPGQLGDPTAKGNTCDVATDNNGCIVTQNLLTPLVSAAEITAAVAGISSAGASAAAAGSAASSASSASSASAASAAAVSAAPAASGAAEAATPASAAGNNVQTFTGALGGAAPPVISSNADAKRPFSVDGSTFVNQGAALQRSCSVQHNACATAANSGQLSGGVGQCETQENACNAAAGVSKRTPNSNSFQKVRRAALDFGSCSDPAIKFAVGLDGRKEAAFAPVNNADFNHGSADNIKIVSGFICQQLAGKCDASAATNTACDAANQAAQAASGQAAADAFNSGLGVSA